MNERTYRQINPDVRLIDGTRRARRRCYYKPYTPRDDRYEWKGYVALVVMCVAWSVFVGWLLNH